MHWCRRRVTPIPRFAPRSDRPASKWRRSGASSSPPRAVGGRRSRSRRPSPSSRIPLTQCRAATISSPTGQWASASRCRSSPAAGWAATPAWPSRISGTRSSGCRKPGSSRDSTAGAPALSSARRSRRGKRARGRWSRPSGPTRSPSCDIAKDSRPRPSCSMRGSRWSRRR